MSIEVLGHRTIIPAYLPMFIDDLIKWYKANPEENQTAFERIFNLYWLKTEEEKINIEKNPKKFMKQVNRHYSELFQKHCVTPTQISVHKEA